MCLGEWHACVALIRLKENVHREKKRRKRCYRQGFGWFLDPAEVSEQDKVLGGRWLKMVVLLNR